MSSKKNYKHKKKFIFIAVLTIIIVFGSIILNIGVNREGPHPDDFQNKTHKSEPAVVNLGSVGDVLLHTPVLASCYNNTDKTYNFEEIFSYLSPYVKKLDYSTANLECSLSSQAWGYSGYPQFKSPESIVDAIKTAGFKMLLTANNHTSDGGSRGIFRTVEVLSQKNTDFIGCKESKNLAPYLVKEINGIKFGMVNYTYGQFVKENVVALNGIPLSEKTSEIVNVFDYNNLDLFYSQMRTLIKSMKDEGAQAIVLYLHWGNEYELKPNKYQIEIAKEMCELGVDVIVGGHPHVVQPIDLFTSSDGSHKMVCIYSLGNIVSNQRANKMNLKTGHTEDGLLFTTTFTKLSDGSVSLTDVDVLPTWVQLSNYNGKNHYKIIPLDKSVDWNKSFNLKADSEKAEKSYNRTMALVSEGIQKFKNYKTS